MNVPMFAQRSHSSASSASPPATSTTPASSMGMLVAPQPINAAKMGHTLAAVAAQSNGGSQARKYQCKMCPQVSSSQ